MPNAISPMMISPKAGTTGFGPSSEDSVARYSSMGRPVWCRGSGDDERHDEADQRQRLGQREAEEQVGPGQAGRLRLPGRRLDVGGEHDADTDAGADGRQAVAEGLDAAVDLSENGHGMISSLQSRECS